MAVEMKNLNIISAGYEHGQRKQGVEQAPTFILTEELILQLKPKMHIICERDFTSHFDNAIMPYYLHKPIEVGKATEKVYEAIMKSCTRDSVSVVVGGDHSIAIGSIAAQLEKYGSDNLGVVWVDAHADLHTLKTTESGNIHGCPVSFLLGIEGMELKSFQWLLPTRPLLKPTNIVYIGLRDVDAAERRMMEKLNIKYYDMNMVKEKGINMVLKETMEILDGKKLYLSFDIDGLDPLVAPATGTAVPDGLSMEEGLSIVKTVACNRNFIGMDLVEVNPLMAKSKDELDITINAAQGLIQAALF